MKVKFEVLYSFQNENSTLIEIKRLDQSPNATPDLIYKWLYVPHSNTTCTAFDFLEMQSSDHHEVRIFKNARLQFDREKAELKLFDLEPLHFKSTLPQSTAPSALQAIQHYLIEESQLKEHSFHQHQFRQLKFSDFEEFQRWINDPEIIRYSLTRFHEMNQPKEQQRWYVEMLSNPKSVSWAITTHSGKLIGYTGISAINSIDQNGEFFILIGDQDHWGKGIATECARSMIQHAFQKLKLHRIFLTASSANEGALRAYQKAGFKEEGRMKDAFFRNNQFSDKVIMGKIL